jgi:hypothetical protein
MRKRTRNIIIIVSLTLILLAAGVIYFLYTFFSAFAPNDITVTKTEIRSSYGFVNSITIERLKVDSFGAQQRPAKYTIEYFTTCSIKQEAGKPPIELKKVKLNESGRYSWSEEKVNIPIVHRDGYSPRHNESQRILLSTGKKGFDICPLKFEKETWYFIHFLDPQIVGIYLYIDKNDNLKQYPTYSGVSPI